jgi:hypothetical protein
LGVKNQDSIFTSNDSPAPEKAKRYFGCSELDLSLAVRMQKVHDFLAGLWSWRGRARTIKRIQDQPMEIFTPQFLKDHSQRRGYMPIAPIGLYTLSLIEFQDIWRWLE